MSQKVCDGCGLAEDRVGFQHLIEGSDGLDYCATCVVDVGVFQVEASNVLARACQELNDLRNAKYAHLQRLPVPKVSI